MPISLDLSKPDSRPYKVTFFTDADTGRWLEELAGENTPDNRGYRSLVCHRIMKAAREANGTPAPEGERRNGERRSA